MYEGVSLFSHCANYYSRFFSPPFAFATNQLEMVWLISERMASSQDIIAKKPVARCKRLGCARKFALPSQPARLHALRSRKETLIRSTPCTQKSGTYLGIAFLSVNKRETSQSCATRHRYGD